MFLNRLVGSIIYLAVVFAAIYFGSGSFAVLCVLLAAIAVAEFNVMLKKKELGGSFVLNIMGVIAVTLCIGFMYPTFLPFVIILLFAVLMFLSMRRNGSPTAALAQLGGIVYIGIGFGCLLAVKSLEIRFMILVPFIIAVITDAGGYLVGSLIGKHKLIPRISPKKSWEGAVGGLVLCVAAMYAYNYFWLHESLIFIAVLSVVGSILGQFGDLVESYFKRWAGVKDSGHLLPGHGGMFDRFDSMLMVAPMVYAACYIMVMLRWAA